MRTFIPAVLLLLMSACNNEEIGNASDVDPQSIYFDYQVSGEEESANVTINLRFRFGGSNGTTLLLNEPSSVKLDGESITVDSSKFDGAYYEIQKPLATFAGNHFISFIDKNGKLYRDSFSFRPFTIEVSQKVSRNGFEIPIRNFDEKDVVQLLITDTAHFSKGIDRIDTIDYTIDNSSLRISKAELSEVKNGPLHLEIIKELLVPLRNTTREGGKLRITYEVRRELDLTD